MLQRFRVGCVVLLAGVRESSRAISWPETVGRRRAAWPRSALRPGPVSSLAMAEWRLLLYSAGGRATKMDAEDRLPGSRTMWRRVMGSF